MKKEAAIIVLLLIGLAGCTIEDNLSNSNKAIMEKPEERQLTQSVQNQSEPEPLLEYWVTMGVAVSGKYADAEVVDIGNGKFRMYYSEEPEVQGFKGRVFSAVSTDGMQWTKESGERKEWATFPDVVKLRNGRFRMYYQNKEVIRSSDSGDGLKWMEEPEARIDALNEGIKIEIVASPTVIDNGDGYIMVYRGMIKEKYPDTPNENTHILWWAISKDGLKWEKKGVAIDSRNEEFRGLLDGPELVKFENETRLFFWSYKGIYSSTFANSRFSTPKFEFSANKVGNYPENPPADPTLAKINGRWFMYYGQHEKGIYYVTSREKIRQEEKNALEPKQVSEVKIPPEIENSCFGFKISSLNKTTEVSNLGAGWVNFNWPKFRWGNIEREKGIFDFTEHDNLLKSAQESNLGLLAEILPFADWDQANDPNCKAKEHDYLCKPKDMQAYKEFVTKVIERYDGDGKDDMPGLKIPVKYWTVISEPDIKKDPYVIFFVGDEEDYKEVLKETYLSIKQACSDCKVIQGAAAGVESEFIDFWDNFFKIGGGEYFDIADVHYVGIDIATGRTVGLGDKSTLNVADFKALLDKHNIKKPLWVSEAVIRSSDSKAALKGALDSGATKIFFVENEYATLEQFGAQGLPGICS